jgi:hypothetical protein
MPLDLAWQRGQPPPQLQGDLAAFATGAADADEGCGAGMVQLRWMRCTGGRRGVVAGAAVRAGMCV